VAERVRIVIRGAVQGVGFRPFVYRLATGLRLAGSVVNTGEGVVLEAEGERAALEALLVRLERERPPLSFIQSLECAFVDPRGETGFVIGTSALAAAPTAIVLPDIATCGACLSEVLDPANRRHRYPFTNCTHCGPRFTIIESLPYDRPRTAMKAFAQCAPCQHEYEDPADRRFHAQPNACPACGPWLELWDPTGKVLGQHDEALRSAEAALAAGAIVAVKGVGGFHLFADAGRDDTVCALRQRKHRQEKPFALMYPSLAAVAADCQVTPLEARLLTASEAPIVLLERRAEASIAGSVAPRNPYLGVMLAAMPLHHLLLSDLGRPLVATSGNLSDEPLCTDEHEALRRLHRIADLYLVHNRPILRHVDDSIVRVVRSRELVLRRARGYAPLPVSLARPLPPLLAVGGHLKSTIALAVGRNVFLSQHLGDLETTEATAALAQAVTDFRALYGSDPERVAVDLHPDYHSTRYGRTLGPEVVAVQHHHAHVAACLADNHIEGPVLGVAWDGSGYGPDGTIWGGEFLVADTRSFRRFAALHPFRLPGGDAAVREPRRAALGLLHALLGDALFERRDLTPVADFTPAELRLLVTMLARGVNAPLTSSAGRLFDGVAALVGLRQRASFEGQAAMELEFALDGEAGGLYPFDLIPAGEAGFTPGPWCPELALDWRALLRAILAERAAGTAIATISARFHATLAAMIVAVAKRAGLPRVVLSGGCFQNRQLVERAVAGLEAAGFAAYTHQRVPPNDGGLALGQAVVASALARPLS